MTDNEDILGSTLLQPGQIIKPNMEDSAVGGLVQRLYGFKVKKMSELNSYDDLAYHILVETEHTNCHVEDVCCIGYVLKISNSLDSKTPDLFNGQHAMMAHLRKHNIPAPVVVKTMEGTDFSIEKLKTLQDNNNPDDKSQEWSDHVVRMIEFIQGSNIYKVTYSPHLLYHVGEMGGKMDKALQEFHHAFYDTHDTIWSLGHTPMITKFSYALVDEDDRRVVTEVIQAFNDKEFHHAFYDTHDTIWSLGHMPMITKFSYALVDEADRRAVTEVIQAFNDQVIPVYGKLRKGQIHGDYNEQNILVQPIAGHIAESKDDQKYEISAVIDFGDCMYSYTVFDLAFAICYMMMDCAPLDPLDVGGHILAGYESVFPINEAEMSILKILVAGRFCQSMTMGAYTYTLDPTNDYIMTTGKNWPILHRIWNTPTDELYSRWRKIVESHK